MSGKKISFDDKKIKKVTSVKTKAYFRCNGNDVIRQLCFRLPQMTGYVNKFNKNVTMSFRVNNNKQLLKNMKKN